MKINHNMAAFVANSQLLRNENKLTSSIEKLSSGYRINHASDDATGMALSSKMRSQIAGLDQASRNASDGTSVIETAEGALGEVTSIMQRMRELTVQAANGTNTDEDKAAIQQEIEKLTEEVDRISKDTEFNKMPLLDGTMERRVYPDTRAISLVAISEQVDDGDYNMTITADASQATVVGSVPVTAGGMTSGTVSVNGVDVRFDGTETDAEIYEALRSAGEKAEINVLPIDGTIPDVGDLAAYPETAGYEAVATGYSAGTQLAFVAEDYGSSTTISIQSDNPALGAYLGIDTTAMIGIGTNVAVSLSGSDFSSQATALTDGKTVTVTDRDGFKMSYDLAAGTLAKEMAADPLATDKDFSLHVTDVGTMTLQVGANEDQTISVDIPNMSASALRIDHLDVTTINGCDKALEAIDLGLSRVLEIRSRLGASENRLEYAAESLGTSSENMTAALSRIEDVDMASEMSTYTQLNVLTQASTSVLAQANDIPQQALQLLQ